MKWILTLLAATLFIIWIASGWFYASWHNSNNEPFQLWKGRLTYTRMNDGWSVGWNISNFSDLYPKYEWNFEKDEENHAIPFSFFSIAIPLWFPFVIISLPTAYTWRQHLLAIRRARALHCPKCSYDRRGLAPAAPCPECNTRV